jgi:hypothetical protein
MRRFPLLFALLICIATPVLAQVPAPVPDAKPPAMAPLDESLEPQVTIVKREGNTMEERRINGKLYEIRVTPAHGVPYTLVDQSGDGSFVRIDSPGSSTLSVPMWVIGTF